VSRLRDVPGLVELVHMHLMMFDRDAAEVLDAIDAHLSRCTCGTARNGHDASCAVYSPLPGGAPLPTFDGLVAAAGPLPTTGMASAESPPGAPLPGGLDPTTIEACAQEVESAGGDNVVFHAARIRALASAPPVPQEELRTDHERGLCDESTCSFCERWRQSEKDSAPPAPPGEALVCSVCEVTPAARDSDGKIYCDSCHVEKYPVGGSGLEPGGKR
jgi:hypothetical protein